MRLVEKGRLLYPSMSTQIFKAAGISRNPSYVKLNTPNKRFDVTAITSGSTNAITILTMEQRLGRIEQSIHLLFVNIKVRIDKEEASLEELKTIVPLASATHTFLCLQQDDAHQCYKRRT